MNDMNSKALYILIAITISFLFTMNSFAYEYKANNGIITLSLPVTRRDIVLSKYLSTFVYVIATIIIMSLIGIVINTFGISIIKIDYITLEEMKAIVFISMFVSSISYPFYYKFDYRKARLINNAIYIGAFISLCSIIPNLNSEPYKSIFSFIKNGYNGSLELAGYAIMVLIFIVSYFISKNIYVHRDI